MGLLSSLLLGGGNSAFGTLGSLATSAFNNAQAYKYWQKQFDYQSAYQDKMWQQQVDLHKADQEYEYNLWKENNAYNSPLEQMNRLKSAGLNPNLIYGHGNVMQNAQLPQVGQYSPAQTASGIGSASFSPAEFSNIDLASVKLMESQANKNNADAKKTDVETQQSEYDLYLSKTFDENLKQLQLDAHSFQNKILKSQATYSDESIKAEIESKTVQACAAMSQADTARDKYLLEKEYNENYLRPYMESLARHAMAQVVEAYASAGLYKEKALVERKMHELGGVLDTQIDEMLSRIRLTDARTIGQNINNGIDALQEKVDKAIKGLPDWYHIMNDGVSKYIGPGKLLIGALLHAK